MENLPGPEPKTETEPKLDAVWFARLAEALEYNDSTEALLDGEKEYRESQKNFFLSGEIENPTLDYPNLTPENLDVAEHKLLALKNEINTNEQIEAVKLAYRWRINEEIARIRMLECTLNNDMRRFSRYAKFIYGEPSLDYFIFTVHEVLRPAKKHDLSESKEERGSLDKLRDYLPSMESSNIPHKPSTETVEATSQIISDELSGLNINFTEKPEIETDEIEAIFNEALIAVGAKDWQIIREPKRTKVDVSQEQRVVRIPAERTVDSEKLKKLVAHEILRHVGRRVNGEESVLSLLGLGLDRYIKGEEGVTKVTEVAVEGKFKSFGAPELHLAVGLARGVDGHPRNFREVFEILVELFTLKAIRNGKEYPDARAEANDKAWSHCVRVFRGTDCKTRGACFPKDIVYREGSIAVWNLISKDTNEVYKFSIGKYDPANDRHLWILSQLGITDERLEELQK